MGRGEFRGKENGTKERNSPLRERREKWEDYENSLPGTPQVETTTKNS